MREALVCLSDNQSEGTLGKQARMPRTAQRASHQSQCIQCIALHFYLIMSSDFLRNRKNSKQFSNLVFYSFPLIANINSLGILIL